MPELPELQALAEGLGWVLRGRRILGVRVHQPSVVKTADPPIEALAGLEIRDVWRRGKLIGVEADGLTLDVEVGDDEVLRLREHATERRASAHLLDAAGLAAHPPLARLGPEPLGLSPAAWRAALGRDSALLHTALRDGRRVAGIGRAYASDIMWAARLAPFARVDRLAGEEVERLAAAADAVLGQALDRARGTVTTDLPTREARVTTVHGHHGEPCLRCGTRLERVSFRDYELVYCPECQTGGRRYRDRRTSRFLR